MPLLCNIIKYSEGLGNDVFPIELISLFVL